MVDITKHTNWLRNDLLLKTVSQRERFLTNAFGTNAYILTRNAELVRLLLLGLAGESAEVHDVHSPSSRQIVTLSLLAPWRVAEVVTVTSPGK